MSRSIIKSKKIKTRARKNVRIKSIPNKIRVKSLPVQESEVIVTKLDKIAMFADSFNGLLMSDFFIGSDAKYNWICYFKHEFLASIPEIKNRLFFCPVCQQINLNPSINKSMIIDLLEFAFNKKFNITFKRKNIIWLITNSEAKIVIFLYTELFKNYLKEKELNDLLFSFKLNKYKVIKISTRLKKEKLISNLIAKKISIIDDSNKLYYNKFLIEKHPNYIPEKIINFIFNKILFVGKEFIVTSDGGISPDIRFGWVWNHPIRTELDQAIYRLINLTPNVVMGPKLFVISKNKVQIFNIFEKIYLWYLSVINEKINHFKIKERIRTGNDILYANKTSFI